MKSASISQLMIYERKFQKQTNQSSQKRNGSFSKEKSITTENYIKYSASKLYENSQLKQIKIKKSKYEQDKKLLSQNKNHIGQFNHEVKTQNSQYFGGHKYNDQGQKVKHGIGMLLIKGKLFYEGQFKDDEITGNGRCYFIQSGYLIYGQFQNGVLKEKHYVENTFFDGRKTSYQLIYKLVNSGQPQGNVLIGLYYSPKSDVRKQNKDHQFYKYVIQHKHEEKSEKASFIFAINDDFKPRGSHFSFNGYYPEILKQNQTEQFKNAQQSYKNKQVKFYYQNHVSFTRIQLDNHYTFPFIICQMRRRKNSLEEKDCTQVDFSNIFKHFNIQNIPCYMLGYKFHSHEQVQIEINQNSTKKKKFPHQITRFFVQIIVLNNWIQILSVKNSEKSSDIFICKIQILISRHQTEVFFKEKVVDINFSSLCIYGRKSPIKMLKKQKVFHILTNTLSNLDS